MLGTLGLSGQELKEGRKQEDRKEGRKTDREKRTLVEKLTPCKKTECYKQRA